MEDTNKYSSPVPLIGLYTAAATCVCLALILCDIWSALRHKKTWVPCRFFSLNSVTLTLLSISTKLPVDLTSPMPSAQDQLSKLTGTVFICMSMGFLLPSIGNMREFECYSNMVALTIFILTVVVNICIQMATGVIFSFRLEHMAILGFMLVLTILLWFEALEIINYKKTGSDWAKRIVTAGTGESLLQRVEVCYLCGYSFNPQYQICTRPYCGFVSLICTICSMVLAEVVLRSIVFKDLKFCEGVSAYGWSMWIVVGIQLLTILFINFAIGRRFLNFVNAMDKRNVKVRLGEFHYVNARMASSPYMPKWLDLSTPIYLQDFEQSIANFIVFATNLFIKVLVLLPRKCRRCMSNHQDPDTSNQNFKQLLEEHNVHLDDWEMRKAVADMEMQMKMNRKKFPQHLRNLLSTCKPSLESFTRELKTAENNLSCLSIILLGEMARVYLPASHISTHLVDVINDVFEIIFFIDNKINNVGNFDFKMKSLTAKILWKGNSTSFVIKGQSRSVKKGLILSHQSDLNHALGALEDFHKPFIHGVVRDEAHAIVKFILSRRPYTSLDDLYNQIKSLLVDMLHEFLTQFPEVICNYIAESPIEEFDERVGLALKFICKLESVESYVIWSFPNESNITSLISVPVSSANTQSNNINILGEDNVNPCTITPMIEDYAAPVVEEASEIQVVQQDENV